MLLAGFFPALVRFDAETGSASSTRDLTSGAGSFQLILEQLHQQVKLWKAPNTVRHSKSEGCGFTEKQVNDQALNCKLTVKLCFSEVTVDLT